ncbi:hypothetical protein MKX08_004498 [Trichoderma sp. CBMAI-0020]|nr:hypothetical protein MKX08_004498 [Trichoderma sp. CBMAI-0020]
MGKTPVHTEFCASSFCKSCLSSKTPPSRIFALPEAILTLRTLVLVISALVGGWRDLCQRSGTMPLSVLLLLLVLDESGVAEEHDGAVIVRVVEARRSEDEGVNVRGGDCHRQPPFLFLLILCGGSLCDVEHARGDVAVDVQVQGVANIGAGTVKGAHLADHGQDGGEGGVGSGEGDVDDGRGVDEPVDGFEGVAGTLVVAADGVGAGLGVFESVAAHDGGFVL